MSGRRGLMRGAVTVVGSCLVAACQLRSATPASSPATPQGVVSYKLIPDGASGQYQLQKTQYAFGSKSTSRVDPLYPAALIGEHLADVTIRVKAIVDEHGAVTEVRDLDTSVSDKRHAMFVDACREAMMRWSFDPLVIVTETDDGRGNVSESRASKAFSQDYSFSFSVALGHPTVATN